jgi:hypothetical protein
MAFDQRLESQTHWLIFLPYDPSVQPSRNSHGTCVRVHVVSIDRTTCLSISTNKCKQTGRNPPGESRTKLDSSRDEHAG